ncbi:MAG: NTP transferase domain-containing protein [Syntrophaceae bacterium]|nr:NTP transferase domain-containing protein [Syntrophaceae bacterium]
MNIKKRQKHIKTAFILSAGRGTRLRPLTDFCPKPLLPIGGRPIITCVMDHLIQTGIKRFIVNTHHLHHVYETVFPDHQWQSAPVQFQYEPVLLDSAGGLKNIEDLLDNDDHAIMVYNADIMTNMPLSPLMDSHFQGGGEVTLALRSSGYLTNVNINEKNEICDIRYILGNRGIKSCQFASIYIVERRFFERLAPGRIESIVDVFIRMIRQNPGSLKGVVIDDGLWEAVNDLETYERIKIMGGLYDGSDERRRKY